MKPSAGIDATSVLGVLQPGLRNELFECFNEILRNYREMRWEPSELNGGKLCEVTYTILKGYVDGVFPPTASKPPNMVDACRSLEQNTPTTFPRSIRIQIPRILLGLYEIRNQRGVGHKGGDVNPNHMDATAVVYMSKWVLAELIRIFHNIDTVTATAVVDKIIERELPIIWCVGNKRRVLDTNLSMKDKMLALVYSCKGTVSEKEILDWLEHSNGSVFRRDVLKKAHKDKLIEYDATAGTIELSPKGIIYVEQNINLASSVPSV